MQYFQCIFLGLLLTIQLPASLSTHESCACCIMVSSSLLASGAVGAATSFALQPWNSNCSLEQGCYCGVAANICGALSYAIYAKLNDRKKIDNQKLDYKKKLK